MRYTALAVLATVLVAFACRTRASAPRELSGVQIADRAKPATVIVIAELDATINVHELTIDGDKLLNAAHDRFDNSKPIVSGIYKAIYEAFLANPSLYLTDTGRVKTMKQESRHSGTGVIIHPNGYIVTNAHVVETDGEDLKSMLVSSISDLVSADIDELRGDIARMLPGSVPTDQAVDRFKKALAEQYVEKISIEEKHGTIRVLLGAKPGSSIAADSKTCEIKKVGKRIPGKDVAILKMEGSDFPTVPLAHNLAEGGVRSGAPLFVLGYPGAVTSDEIFTVTSRMEASWSQGVVSGIKSMADGWKVIQTDATINPGNSGGPVFNDKGEVVGLATFMVRGEDNGPTAQGLNFVVSIDVVNEFLNELNLKPEQSRFTGNYLKALDAYEAHKDAKALELFQQLYSTHPESGVVQEFIKQLGATPDANTAVRANSTSHYEGGTTQSSGRSSRPLMVLLIIGVLIGLVLVVVVLANR